MKLTLRNRSERTQTVHVSGLHNAVNIFELESDQVTVQTLDPLADNHGWYDVVVSVQGHPVFTRFFAGHLGNGEPSRTSPN